VIHRRALIFFTLYFCAITYLSLYPWEFLLHARANQLLWAPLSSRRQLLDAILNILFYVPLGASGFLLFRPARFAWISAVVAGSALSWTIEWLQLWSPTRFGNLTDLTSNVLGTALGASVAWAATHWLAESPSARTAASRWRLTPTQTLFVSAWTLWQVFPFIPVISLGRLTNLPTALHAWSWQIFVATFLGFAVLRFALGRSPWLWLSLAALPAQAFLIDRSLSISAVAGAVLGWRIVERASARWFGLILPVYLVFEELRPFTFAATASPFAWAPFGSWYEIAASGYYPVIFGKLFLYLSTIWGLRARSAGWLAAVGIPAAILAAGEWLQRYIPGRTPESTDLVLLVSAAVLLGLCEKPKTAQS